jgi:hypothetical protein
VVNEKDLKTGKEKTYHLGPSDKAFGEATENLRKISCCDIWS